MRAERTISTIAWDLDNTLIDRDGGLQSFFENWLARRFDGADIAPLLAFIRLVDRSGEGDRLEFCEQVLERCGLSRTGAAALWNELQRDLPGCLELDPRVTRLLDSLAPGYHMVIVTNGGSTFQRAKVRHAGLGRWFDKSRVFVSGEIGAAKPERACFDAVLKSTSTPPAEMLFVGDHPCNDIHGAAACGMQTCWVSLGRPRPESLPADFAVERVWELEPLLSSQAALTSR